MNDQKKPIPIRLKPEVYKRLRLAALYKSTTVGAFVEDLLTEYEKENGEAVIITRSTES